MALGQGKRGALGVCGTEGKRSPGPVITRLVITGLVITGRPCCRTALTGHLGVTAPLTAASR
jgi:hypothetical protein